MQRKITTLIAAAAVVGCLGMPAQAQQRLSVASGPLGGTWLPLGTALAKIISQDLDGIEANAEVTEGSVQNIRLINSHNVDFGLLAPNVLYDGYNSKGRFEGEKYENLRAVFAAMPAAMHIFARKDSGIEKLSDIKGKRITFGPHGAGGTVMAIKLLEVAGLSDAPRSIDHMADTEQFSALGDGKVDAVFVSAGMFASYFQEYTTTHAGEYRLISVDAPIIAKMNEDAPFFAAVKMPKGTYTGQDTDAVSFGSRTIIVAHKDVPDTTVYEFVKSVFTDKNLAFLAATHASYKAIGAESGLDSIATPLHPGARKYWSEQNNPRVNEIPQ